MLHSTLQRKEGGDLHMEQVSLEEIAQHYGTPVFVYSKAAIRSAYESFDASLSMHPHNHTAFQWSMQISTFFTEFSTI